MNRRLLTILLPVLVGALMIVLWYIFRLHVLDTDRRFLLPAPDAILRASSKKRRHSGPPRSTPRPAHSSASVSPSR